MEPKTLNVNGQPVRILTHNDIYCNKDNNTNSEHEVNKLDLARAFKLHGPLDQE